jgi:hypothetical protein
VPTRSTGPLAPVLLRAAETQVGRAPPMVGSVRGSLKRFDDDLVLGVRGGGGSSVGVYIGENLRRTDRGIPPTDLISNPSSIPWFC